MVSPILPTLSTRFAALGFADRPQVDLLNAPEFAHVQDVLDSAMKNLQSTGNFKVCQAVAITEEVEDLL